MKTMYIFVDITNLVGARVDLVRRRKCRGRKQQRSFKRVIEREVSLQILPKNEMFIY